MVKSQHFYYCIFSLYKISTFLAILEEFLCDITLKLQGWRQGEGYNTSRNMLAPRRKVKKDFLEIFGIHSTYLTVF